MQKNHVKILLLDVEMAPMLSYHWGLFDQNIPTSNIKERTSMLAWGAKWLGEKKIIYHDQSKKPKHKIRDDKSLIEKLWRMLRRADIVIAHNLPFDKKKSNARMLVHNMKPVNPYREICTLKIARKHFKMDSNKLVDLGVALGIAIKKYSHSKYPGNELFIKCVEGDKGAWREMKKYNPIDLLLLEEIYLRLAPWDQSINFNVFHDHNENKCQCGSFVVKKEGKRTTNVGRYQRYSCSTCGRWWHGKINKLSLIKRRDMLK